MKKTLTFVLTLVLAFTMCFSVYAHDSTYTYEYGNKTVIFNETTQFSAEQRVKIAEYLVNGAETSDAETYGLTCTLFGHKYVVEDVTTITHCASDTQPRCLEEDFEIGECSRCGHTYSNRIGFCYITCCD